MGIIKFEIGVATKYVGSTDKRELEIDEEDLAAVKEALDIMKTKNYNSAAVSLPAVVKTLLSDEKIIVSQGVVIGDGRTQGVKENSASEIDFRRTVGGLDLHVETV